MKNDTQKRAFGITNGIIDGRSNFFGSGTGESVERTRKNGPERLKPDAFATGRTLPLLWLN
jgi:hypothetical protein